MNRFAEILLERLKPAKIQIIENLLEKGLLKELEIHLAEANEDEEIYILGKLASFYEDKGDYAKAFDLFKEMHHLKKTYFIKIKEEKITEIRKRSEVVKKEALYNQQVEFRDILNLKNEELDQALKRQRFLELHVESLQMQLSPHFIFNFLQTVQSLIFRKEALYASDSLAQFAKLMRSILSSSRSGIVDLMDEIAMLENYLELEKMRLPFPFKHHISCEKIADNEQVFLPSLLIKSFVENAIEHGINNKDDGEISVVFRKDKGVVYVHVLDNGVGRDLSALFKKVVLKKGRSSLDVINERAELSQSSTEMNFSLKILNRKRKKIVEGTHVVLRIVSLNNEKNLDYDKSIIS